VPAGSANGLSGETAGAVATAGGATGARDALAWFEVGGIAGEGFCAHAESARSKVAPARTAVFFMDPPDKITAYADARSSKPTVKQGRKPKKTKNSGRIRRDNRLISGLDGGIFGDYFEHVQACLAAPPQRANLRKRKATKLASRS